jgi:Flp pilus assembly pilin Flp
MSFPALLMLSDYKLIPTMIRIRASIQTVAGAQRRFWRNERGATVVEYGLAVAMLLTVIGGIDSLDDPAPVNDRAVCAAIERRGNWLDKDRIAADASEEICLAGRPGAASGRD